MTLEPTAAALSVSTVGGDPLLRGLVGAFLPAAAAQFHVKLPYGETYDT